MSTYLSVDRIDLGTTSVGPHPTRSKTRDMAQMQGVSLSTTLIADDSEKSTSGRKDRPSQPSI